MTAFELPLSTPAIISGCSGTNIIEISQTHTNFKKQSHKHSVKMPSRPAFDELPLRKDGPPGNAWGLFGADDQSGMLNLLTPETTANAAREIVEGVRISTDWALDSMSTPCFGRPALQHTIKHKAPRTVNDDELVFNTQSSSQWDGFRHYGYQKEKIYFNGKSQEDVMNTHVNGIHGMPFPRVIY